MQTCFTLYPPPPPPHMDDYWKWWQTQTAHVLTFLSAPIEVVTSPTMDPITRRLPNVISAQLMLQKYANAQIYKYEHKYTNTSIPNHR